MSLNEDEKPSESPSEAITAYCVKCNETTTVTDVEHWESNNKTGVRGRCSVCRGGMFKFTGSKCRNHPPGYWNKRKRELAAEKRRAKLLDGVPPIKASYICDQEDPHPNEYR